jgi:hypothetical protein
MFLFIYVYALSIREENPNVLSSVLEEIYHKHTGRYANCFRICLRYDRNLSFLYYHKRIKIKGQDNENKV